MADGGTGPCNASMRAADQLRCPSKRKQGFGNSGYCDVADPRYDARPTIVVCVRKGLSSTNAVTALLQLIRIARGKLRALACAVSHHRSSFVNLRRSQLPRRFEGSAVRMK